MGTKQNKQRNLLLFEYANKMLGQKTEDSHSKAFLDLFYIM